jgi:DNA-binding NarL/FixJ family response regulator
LFSSYDDLKIIQEVEIRVSGYLTKQCAGDNIVEAIHAVANGEEYFCNTVREKYLILQQKNNSKLNKHNSIIDSLLTGEIEIIILIALGIVAKKSEKLFISTNTVETHRKNIMKS